MMTHLSFSSNEVLTILMSVIFGIVIFIISNRSLIRSVKSFDFNFSHYMIGVVTALLLCVAFFNLETPEKEYAAYHVEEIGPEYMTPITHWPDKKKVDIPPPVKQEKIELFVPKDKFIVKAVDKIEETITVDMVDESVEVAVPNIDTMMRAAKEVKPSQPEVEEEPLIIADQMPRFPGCEDLELSPKEKEKCSQKELLDYIYDELKYPAMARSTGIEGQVVLRFVVEKDGSVGNIKLLRDIGGGCGNAAVETVESMNQLPKKWRPGMQKGHPVRVMYTLPIKFKLK